MDFENAYFKPLDVEKTYNVLKTKTNNTINNQSYLSLINNNNKTELIYDQN